MRAFPVEVAGTGRLDLGARLALVAEILAVYVSARRRMRREDLPRLLLALRAQPAAARSRGSASDPSRLGRAVRRTLHVLPTDSRCLIQSLVLTRVLAHRGFPSRLVLGASVADGFTAHAWVEYEGRPLLPPGGPGFERLVEL